MEPLTCASWVQAVTSRELSGFLVVPVFMVIVGFQRCALKDVLVC